MDDLTIRFISKTKEGVILTKTTYFGTYIRVNDGYVILYEDVNDGKGRITIKQGLNCISFTNEINGCTSYYEFNIAKVTKATFKDNLSREQTVWLKTDEIKLINYLLHISYHLFAKGQENNATYYELITEEK